MRQRQGAVDPGIRKRVFMCASERRYLTHRRPGMLKHQEQLAQRHTLTQGLPRPHAGSTAARRTAHQVGSLSPITLFSPSLTTSPVVVSTTRAPKQPPARAGEEGEGRVCNLGAQTAAAGWRQAASQPGFGSQAPQGAGRSPVFSTTPHCRLSSMARLMWALCCSSVSGILSGDGLDRSGCRTINMKIAQSFSPHRDYMRTAGGFC